MNKLILKYALFIRFVPVLLVFVCFVNTVNAEYYDSYYNYSSSYPYQENYNNYSPLGNNSFYPYYSNSNTVFNYSNYGQSCPTGYSLGVQNGTYICYVNLNDYYNSYNSYYNNNQIQGCLPGYIYSSLTGQKCNQSNYYNYDYYSKNNDGEITSFDVREGNDTKLEEGDNNKEILKIRFNVSDGDIELDKVKFNFEFRGNSYNEDKPWNVFDEMILLSNGKQIEKMNIDSKSDWGEEGDDNYSITFTNLNEKIRENDRANLTLLVDINSNISGVNNSINTWDVSVPDRGIKARALNRDFVYAGDDQEIVSVEIDQ